MKKEDKELIELFASIKQHQKNIERQEKIFSAIEKKAKQSNRKKTIVFWSAISSIAACFCIVWFSYSPIDNSEIIIENKPIAKTIVEKKQERMPAKKSEPIVKEKKKITPIEIPQTIEQEIIIEQDSTIVEPEPKQEMIVKEEKVIEPEIVRVETDKLICYKKEKKNNLNFSFDYARREKKELFLIDFSKR
ncbi:MAG: hypothetical protein IKV46_02195 [Bacteroidales bacterium]|nr:hypothetical protein [Bacteroidales bacterium]